MAAREAFLRDNPSLDPYVLSDVQLTGVSIGNGAYGCVDEVSIPVLAAAKRVHDSLLEADCTAMSAQFAQELQLMSTLHHRNVINLLGIYFFPGSALPALVMERLMTSLHDLLKPDTARQRPKDAPEPLSYFTMDLKCSILQDVASGLAYLHGRSPPVIHRDLSARNVLLTTALVAKIADLGVARIVPEVAAATMTRAPGASIYMPPEAVTPSGSSRNGGATYDTSIDVFSFGVVTIFTIGEVFPHDPLAPTYTDEGGRLIARSELERRSEYMKAVNTNMEISGKVSTSPPIIRLIEQCLQNQPPKRPGINDVLCMLEDARADFKDEESEKNRQGLVHALQYQLSNYNFKQVFRDLEQEIAELQQQLFSSEEETKLVRQQLEELSRREETLMREMREQVEESELAIKKQLEAKDMELAQVIRQQVEESELAVKKQLEAKDMELAQALEEMRQQNNELIQAKENELDEMKQQLEEKTKHLELIKAENRTLEQDLAKSEESCRDLQQQIHDQYNECRPEHDDVFHSLPENPWPLHSLPGPFHSLPGSSLQPRSLKMYEPQVNPQSLRHLSVCNRSKLTIKLEEEENAPKYMTTGSATTDYRSMYFISKNSKLVQKYEWSSKKWSELLSPCPFTNSSLAFIGAQLTTIGGVDDQEKPTKKLFTLDNGEWSERYPAMNIARYCAAVISEKDNTLVIGGRQGQNDIEEVELLAANSNNWCKIQSLPKALKFPSATKSGNCIFVAGQDGDAFFCSLKNIHEETSSFAITFWADITSLPVTHSTAATLNGTFVVVGGQFKDNKSIVKSIYQLVEGAWELIGNMSCERFSCLIVAPSPKELMIVGGFKNHARDELNTVEHITSV